MIGKQRTTPAILLIALGSLALLLRQAWVQVREHDVWAEQAARLERSGELIPYRRGSIVDASGRTLVSDIEAYHLQFSYRAFRREHPLGQVTHGASVLLLEPVSLELGLLHAPAWARALVGLTPGDLRGLARGQGLELGRPLDGLPASWDVAAGRPRRIGAVVEDVDRYRLDLSNRAGDLGFYIGGLLQLDRDEKKDLLRAADDKQRRDRSYLELVADLRDVRTEDLADEVERHVVASLADLDLLAERMDFPADPGRRPGVPLVAELEDWRRAIEDAAARRLFREAAGFDPGRIEPGLLFEHFDLEWFAVHLRWDAQRTMAWCHSVRGSWAVTWRGNVALLALVAELRSSAGEPGGSFDARDVVAMLSSIWYGAYDRSLALDGTPAALADRGELEVFAALERVLDADLPAAPDPDDPRLPWSAYMAGFGDPDAPGLPLAELADALGDGAPGTSAYRKRVGLLQLEAEEKGRPHSRAYLWQRHFSRSGYRSAEHLTALAGELLDAWEVRIQALLEERLVAARFGGGEPGRTPRLVMRPEALERAADRARFVLRDYGRRRSLLDDQPEFDVVQLLTRFPERFPGFGAHEARERIANEVPERGLPGQNLIGMTAMLDAAQAQAQRADARRLRTLRRQGRRTAAEEAELVELVARVLTAEEAGGVSGIEGSWDPILRGYNGYRERVGLEEVDERPDPAERDLRPVQDGRDLALTLDARLQIVAEEVLEWPVVPDRESDPDLDWLADPEGAIVVLRPNGDLVVAASGPAPWSERVDPELSGERRVALERCFTKADFKPPGSTFKPFVALAALELGKLGPAEAFVCLAEDEDVGSNKGVYKGVHCHKTWGHSNRDDGSVPPLDLTEALRTSCNVFFAHLGERLATGDLRSMAHAFGFGQPSGVLSSAEDGGFVENSFPELFEDGLALRNRMRAANGLSVVEATPVQLARAFAGLATGALPEVRLVDAIEGESGFMEQVPRAAPEPLPYGADSFDMVRTALVEVAAHPDGSAHAALAPEQVGFGMAVKTGSADLTWLDEERTILQKHTWVAGWAPVEDPEVVFVFFVRKTTKSSGHTSVWLARQFFLQPEVRAFLEAEGMTLEDVAIDARELGR